MVKKLQRPYRIDFSEEDIQKIIIACQAGISKATVAKEYNCCVQTISTLLKKKGIKISKRRVLDSLPASDVIAMYTVGQTTTDEIAKHYSVSSYTIRKLLKEHGIKMRNRYDYIKS